MRKRIISLLLCTVMLLLACVPLSSCSGAPEYAEIEQRFKELVKASADINRVLFGEGLPTFERINDPWEDMKVHVVENADGSKAYYYYCYINDETHGEILAYRTGYTKPKQYLSIHDAPISDGEEVYRDVERQKYYYALEGYSEPEVDFYYTSQDPDNYDYVRPDSPYLSVDEIKEAAEKVYSKDYLESSVYVALFTGAAAGEGLQSLSARYIEYYDEGQNTTSFMMSNTYPPLITETRVFDFSTAEMVRPSNKKLISIRIESYLPSAPEARIEVTLTMVKQDGEWFLDSATY